MKRLRKILFLTIPAAIAAVVLAALLIEAWVRLSWDDKRGTPGFFVSDPVRGQRLSANYAGWFAGVPVRTNSLGFRSSREDVLAKGPNTFRILVLGDSVTFGHGAVHDYPSLLEDLLKKWRPEIDWQVWNLGVPGYNTSQELSYLLEVGPTYKPDLVIVGFFLNDIVANRTAPPPGVVRVAASRVLAFMQRHWYSVELYKRVILTAAWKMSGTLESKQRFENLDDEERIHETLDEIAASDQQQLRPFTRLTPTQAAAQLCLEGMREKDDNLEEMQAQPGWPAFVEAVRAFQQLHKSGQYKIVFFLNLVPPFCPGDDFFYDARPREHEFFYKLFSDGVPTVSAYREFLLVKPSEMPQAEAHAIGNSNLLKAEILLKGLRESLANENGRP